MYLLFSRKLENITVCVSFFFAGIYVCLLIQYLYIYSKYVYVVVSVAVVVVVHLSIHCRDTHAVKAIICVHVTGKIDSSD